MPRHTLLVIIATAALMTFQAALLAVITCSHADAAPRKGSVATANVTPSPSPPAPKVYRCRRETGARGTLSYQHKPCDFQEGTHVLRLTGIAPPSAVDQAAPPPSHAQGRTKKTRSARDSKRKLRQRTSRLAEAQAGLATPLTRHRPGERPFEHLGQQVSVPGDVDRKRRKRGKARKDFVARVPDRQGTVNETP